MSDVAITVCPSEFKFALRLKRSRFLLKIGETPLGDLQARLDRVSKYAVKRLQRKYPCLGISVPTWSIDANPTNVGMTKWAYCRFDYVDLGPYTDEPQLLRVLPQEAKQISMIPNRAQRRAHA